ncbi:hypothetical protein BOTBODRAFT_37204, partial [Botryobasidium botryosum FD-172 SS1]
IPAHAPMSTPAVHSPAFSPTPYTHSPPSQSLPRLAIVSVDVGVQLLARAATSSV